MSTAHNNSHNESITHLMTISVLQVGIILFVAWIGGRLAKLLKLPSVVGQIIGGIIIGPFALGGLGFLGFPAGLFPVLAGPVPVSPMIYTLATIASIILLFMSGLETDLAMFLRYAVKGGIIGLGGVVVSFVSGIFVAAGFLGVSVTSPSALFLGTVSVATSIGITASILSQKRKIDSPEGTVILAAAVIDDILGILILAIVLAVSAAGLTHTPGNGEPIGEPGLLSALLLGFRALGVWAGATALGIGVARPLARWMKQTFRSQNLVAIMALALALIVSGLFELAGLSMIIGAYVVGMALSNTDLAFMIQHRLRTLHDFFIPLFFVVSGMMVNIQVFTQPEVVTFGLVFLIFAIIAKLIGSGLPALGLGFTGFGALRVGLGMVPRGEVALIIAALGVSSGILSESAFGAALIMTIGTTVLAPPLLQKVLDSPKPGQKNPDTQSNRIETPVDFQSDDFASILVPRFLQEMEKEGYFVNRMEHDDEILQLRRNESFITLSVDTQGKGFFRSTSQDIPMVQTAMYETLLEVSTAASELKNKFQPVEMARQAFASASLETAKPVFDLDPFLKSMSIKLRLDAKDKEGVIRELAGMLTAHITDWDEVIKDLFEREASLSTGMQYGVALPHCKTNGVDSMVIAFGMVPQGIDFKSLDSELSRIFVMILSPKRGYGPHIQLMAAMASLLNNQENRNRLLDAKLPADIKAILGLKSSNG
jgi:Kef-type K+ transport system membrane component KefB/mannitol/fructose-specific phosphotransferase system IIA component (Ntr-type)